MSEVAIQADHLGKRFRIGENRGYRTARDTLAALFRAPFRRFRNGPSPSGGRDANLFWALTDLSFTIERGEAVGILGANGAGKSTLLKVLSRITEPTTGSAQITGRLSSLLEVGTGFHAELSGRENIYLNGAILGMRRAEIARRFDEIVDFAEIEKFIDTPVKHYSTGMYLRLAFGVAAHLETEILLVDEVLAVGDAQFQRKCLGKMGEVARHGRTVLFVSHNMMALQSMCQRAIWLQLGKIEEDGPVGQVTSNYLRTASRGSAKRLNELRSQSSETRVKLERVSVRSEEGPPGDPITVRTPFLVEFDFWNLREGMHLNLMLHVYNEQGVIVFNTFPVGEDGWYGRSFPVGLFRSVCHIPGDLLNSGIHRIAISINPGHTANRYDDALVFEVLDSPEVRGGWHGKWVGAVRPRLSWKTERLSSAVEDSPLAAETLSQDA